MKLLSVSLARLTALTETAELNPRNQISVPQLVHGLTERYGFMKYPRTIEEFDASKGIIFSLGRINNINIERLELYFIGVVIETRSSTEDCEVVLDDLSHFVQQLVEIEYTPISEPRKFFLSELSFHSELNLNGLNKAFASVLPKMSQIVSSHARQEFKFETVAILGTPDLANIKIGPPLFRIDRLGGVPFQDNKYFSSAPLPTKNHLQILEEFEKSFMAS